MKNKLIELCILIFFCFILFIFSSEHGLQSTLAHPPTINNNNSSINNNNHSTKSGTNSTKLVSNDDHQQPLIATIHRNAKTSAAIVANKAVAVPQIKSKPTGKSSLVNGELNEHLIEFSITDSTDGVATTGRYALAKVSPKPDKSIRNSNQATVVDLNVIQANKTIVALSILIQHLTTNVSVFAAIPHIRAR